MTGARVYVLRTTDGGATYLEVVILTASDAAAGDYFGQLRGDRRRHRRDRSLRRRRRPSGSVYVFRTTDGGATYSQVAKLTAADAAAWDEFGVSVAIDGDTVVVGDYDDWSARAHISVYVFHTSDGGATMTSLPS